MSKSKQDDRQEDRAALFPSTRLKVQDLVVLDYETNILIYINKYFYFISKFS